MLRIRTPSLGDGGAAASADFTGSVTQAFTASGTLTNPVDIAGTPTAANATASGTVTNPVDAAGSVTQAFTASGTITNPVDIEGAATAPNATAEGEFFGGEVDLEGSVTLPAPTASGTLDTGSAEALPRGGFLPDDWEGREKRRKAIRATLEGVARPKPAQVAETMREAVAPASEPPAVTMRDAVSPATMEGLRRLAENARARHAALDDDDEDVLMLLGV